MPPKPSDGKPPKRKPSTTKRTTTEGKTAKKPGSKPVASGAATRLARPQAKEPQASSPDPSMALSEELREQIAQRAYEIHHRRGGQHGSDWEDWLQAEREILLQQSPPL